MTHTIPATAATLAPACENSVATFLPELLATFVTITVLPFRSVFLFYERISILSLKHLRIIRERTIESIAQLQIEVTGR